MNYDYFQLGFKIIIAWFGIYFIVRFIVKMKKQNDIKKSKGEYYSEYYGR